MRITRFFALKKIFLMSALPVLTLVSCQKYVDVPGQSDPRLSRKYCNDPEAVNYDLDFPGTADNSVCYYPADAFQGSYLFIDSVYNGLNALTRQWSLNLHFTGLTRTKLDISGFCPGGDLLHFTANRALLATGDTTILNGQMLCQIKDTISGTITRSLGDSSRLQFSLTVVSDTGVTTHRGTAYRQ